MIIIASHLKRVPCCCRSIDHNCKKLGEFIIIHVGVGARGCIFKIHFAGGREVQLSGVCELHVLGLTTCVGCDMVQADHATEAGVAQGIFHGILVKHHGRNQEEVEEGIEENAERDRRRRSNNHVHMHGWNEVKWRGRCTWANVTSDWFIYNTVLSGARLSRLWWVMVFTQLVSGLQDCRDCAWRCTQCSVSFLCHKLFVNIRCRMDCIHHIWCETVQCGPALGWNQKDFSMVQCFQTSLREIHQFCLSKIFWFLKSFKWEKSLFARSSILIQLLHLHHVRACMHEIQDFSKSDRGSFWNASWYISFSNNGLDDIFCGLFPCLDCEVVRS